MVAARFGAEPAGRTGEFARELGALPGARIVTVNHLGQAGWRDHLWHEPHPPHVLIELGFDGEDAAAAFAGLPELAVLHSSVANAGGDVECYLVTPRCVI